MCAVIHHSSVIPLYIVASAARTAPMHHDGVTARDQPTTTAIAMPYVSTTPIAAITIDGIATTAILCVTTNPTECA